MCSFFRIVFKHCVRKINDNNKMGTGRKQQEKKAINKKNANHKWIDFSEDFLFISLFFIYTFQSIFILPFIFSRPACYLFDRVLHKYFSL